MRDDDERERRHGGCLQGRGAAAGQAAGGEGDVGLQTGAGSQEPGSQSGPVRLHQLHLRHHRDLHLSPLLLPLQLQAVLHHGLPVRPMPSPVLRRVPPHHQWRNVSRNRQI